MADPQREGRQLHRYRRRIVQLTNALEAIRKELDPEHLADHDEAQIGSHLEHAYMLAEQALAGTARARPVIIFRPLLVSGCVGEVGEAGRSFILIDDEQPESEQLAALWHETLHLLGLTDEAQVEALALQLAGVCPEILPALKALPQ